MDGVVLCRNKSYANIIFCRWKGTS